MADRPVIFISATSDLRSARDLVGKVLYSMGYEPIWQDIAAVEGGEMLAVLRRRLAPASLVIQFVGRRYGSEPPHPTAEFGRVSYTQFEALEAERTGKKVIYYFLEDKFPTDPVDPEPAELVSLQAAYCQRLMDANLLRQDKIAGLGDLELSIYRIRDELALLREEGARFRRNLVRMGIAILVGMAAVGILAFIIFNRQEKDRTTITKKLDQLANETAKLRADSADVKAAISPKLPIPGQTQPPPLSPDIVEKAKELVARGDAEQRALGLIALKKHAEANRIIQELKNRRANPIDDAFRLLTMEGDNWYQANEPDKAIEPYEKAMALKPNDLQARRNIMTALVFARLGDVLAKRQRAIKIGEKSVQLALPGSIDWARMQNNLGVAWWAVPTKNKAENLKSAIAALEATLTVYTKATHPADWARTQSNLALAWRELPTGDKTENVNKAIRACEAALTVYTKDAYQAEWARTQVNLGIAWSELQGGNNAENLKKAMGAYDAALTFFTKEQHPAEWAMTQNNLGNAWSALPSGDTSQNLTKAIAAYEAALSVYTKEAYPAEWANTQIRLGGAWSVLPTGRAAENVTKAITSFNVGLTVLTEKAYPAEWADAQIKLGSALLDLPTGSKAENVTKAIEAYQASLRVYTKDTYPTNWARAHYNLGIAWDALPKGEKSDNRKEAVAAFKEALSTPAVALPARLRRNSEIGLSSDQLLMRDFVGALSTCEGAPSEDDRVLDLRLNRAHALLLLGRIEEAWQIYGKIAQRGEAGKRRVLEEFEDLEKNGLKSPEFAKIRKMLKSKTSNAGSAGAAEQPRK